MSWKSIWNSKKVDLTGDDLLASLIKADGFDTGFGNYSVKDWLLMVQDASSKCNASDNDVILEIGCGAGAFLYSLSKFFKSELYGIDYSHSLVSEAKKYLPNAHIFQSEATTLSFDNSFFDIIFSHGVFFYFPSHEYVDNCIEEISKKLKSGGRVCLMDLNDAFLESQYHEYRMKNYSSPAEYHLRYSGLEHLFFEKEVFKILLNKHGFTNVKFFEHKIHAYLNSQFRFNVIAEKL